MALLLKRAGRLCRRHGVCATVKQSFGCDMLKRRSLEVVRLGGSDRLRLGDGGGRGGRTRVLCRVCTRWAADEGREEDKATNDGDGKSKFVGRGCTRNGLDGDQMAEALR